MRLGLSVPLGGLDLPGAVELAVQSEALGYHEVWSSEIGRSDGFSILAAIAARTELIGLGVAVVPVQTRPPALLAMSAAAVNALSGGRFSLGLGASTARVVEQWMGLVHDPSVVRMRETVAAIRSALLGERVALDGERVRIGGFRIEEPEPIPVPILLGALGPRMRRLAGQVADGIVLSHVGRAAVAGMLEPFRDGLREAGRREDEVAIVHRVGVVLGPPTEQDAVVLRAEIAAYGRAPAYRRSFATQGFSAEADALTRAWARRDPAAASRAVSDQMLEQLFVRGDEAQCRAAFAEYACAGVTTLVLVPIALDADLGERARRRAETLQRLAPESA
jgi:probable F420-dependent oxidoreductase